MTHPETVVHHGISIPLDESVMSADMMEIIRVGKYEHLEAFQVPRIISPGERILEIGAGLGFISALAALNPDTAAVRAYEANPNLLPFIRRLHSLNGVSTVDVRNGVLTHAPHPPALPFYLRKNFWASSLSDKPLEYVEQVEVPAFDFNEVLREFKPTLIICDIEGGELELFRKADLAGVRKVYIELHQRLLGRVGMLRLFRVFGRGRFHYDQHHSCNSVVLFSHVRR